MSRRVVTLIVTVLGIALFAWQVRSIGTSAIIESFGKIGAAGFAAVLFVSLIRQVFRASSWVLLMASNVPFTRAFAATICGDAMGNLTPFSLIVSEPTKAMYVRAYVPVPRALAALAAENFFYSLSVAITLLIGVSVLFLEFTPEHELRTASLIIVAAMAFVLLAALWLIVKQPAFISATLGRFVNPRTLEKIRSLESSAYEFARMEPARLASVIACEFGFHVFSIAEQWILLQFIGVDEKTFALAVVLDTVQRVINVVFRVVPLKVGVDESSAGLVTNALGYGSALGIAMALVRKIRVLIWAGVGLALLASQREEKTAPST